MSDSYSRRTGRRILVIRNPIAGRRHGNRFGRVLDALCARGCMVTVCDTSARGDAEAFARAASADSYDVLAVAGGDGTINEAINGLTDFRLALAVIPLGTANCLAREIGLKGTPGHVAEVIAAGTALPVKLGRANDRRFIQMAGVGFDAQVVAKVDPKVKRHLGKGAYVAETFMQMLKYPFPRYRLTVDGRPVEAASAVIANGRYYGGSFKCAPQARLEDDAFQVCLFQNGGTWNALRYGWGLMSGRLKHFRDVAVVAAREITVEGPDGDPVQGDGDIVCSLPLSLTMEEKRVNLLTPA